MHSRILLYIVLMGLYLVLGPTHASAQQDTVRAPADSFDVVQLESLLVSVLRTPVELGNMPF